ncbi:MAG TPA: hypothetical protein VIX84_12840 [Acidimicrobiales bacterium]
MRRMASTGRGAAGLMGVLFSGAALMVLGAGAGPAGATEVSHALLTAVPSGVTFEATTLGDLRFVAFQVTNTSTTMTDTISGSVTTGANPNDFGAAPEADCPSDANGDVVLPPTTSCHIDAVFFPGALGARSGTLNLNDSLNSAVTVNVSGTGSIGYYEVSNAGAVAHFGDATFHGDASNLPLSHPIVGIAQTGDDGGYWLAASDGGIFNYGDAGFFGSAGGLALNKPIVGMAPTFDGGGYWEVATDGGIFSYGDAPFYGSTGAIHLNKPIVGMAATPDGGGYWLVASDGGLFAYGDAQFYGSTGAIHLNKPIVGMASTPDGGGYWLVASDGGIFAFGDALFYGSTGAIHLNQPIVGMAAMPDGSGYWFAAADGGLFNYGAPFYGSATGQIGTVVGIASDGAPTIQAFTDSPALRSRGLAHGTGTSGWAVVPTGTRVEG